MDHMRHRIAIETLENGYQVEVPDMAAIKKAAAKRKPDTPMPYMGDMTKKYAAKSVKDVIKIVTDSLKSMPEVEYEEAFKEAAHKA